LLCAALSAACGGGVPILMYHSVGDGGDPLTVAPQELDEQLDFLRSAGFETVTLRQVLDAQDGAGKLPRHPVVLTFDDGYADFATAAVPVLRADHLVATDFVVSGFMGRPSYMTAAQVQSVNQEGMVIGAHTVHHVDLVALPAPAAAAEIATSRATLQGLLGHLVDDFAYPYGDVDPTVAALVAAAGFRDAVTTEAGTSQCASAPDMLRRIRIGGSDTVWSFASKAEIPEPPSNWQDPLQP